ncbi:alpha-protein kinase 2 [Channa argus]
MDLSLLCRDDEKQSSPVLRRHRQTGDVDVSLSNSLEENKPSVSKNETWTPSGHSGCADNSTEPLSNISESFSHYSEPALKDDFSVHDYFGSSHLQLSHGLTSPPSECFSEIHTQCESGLSFSLIQDIGIPQPSGAISSNSEDLMESSTTQLLSSHGYSSEHSQATFLVRSLSPQSDSLESDAAIAPVSDLYIFESETQDFILSPKVAPQEIKCPECQPLSQTGEKEADGDCDTHVLTCDSADVATHCHCSSTHKLTMVDDESDVIKHMGLRTPVTDACEAHLMPVNDSRQRKAEDTCSTLQLWQSDSPTELWLDACQYLAGEDTEDRDALDKTGYSVAPGGHLAISDLSFLPGQTQVSGHNPEGSEGIGWSSTRNWGPPVERWSSVDSWASALSDWTGIITGPSEDITAAFTEIGAEIDALTQALVEVNTHIDAETLAEGDSRETTLQAQLQPLMGVQDHPLEAQNFPESSVLSAQGCRSLCFKTPGPELQYREGSQTIGFLCDLTRTTQGEKEPEEIQSTQAACPPSPIHQLSGMGSSSGARDSPGGQGADVTTVALTPESNLSCNLDLSYFGVCDESLDTDTLISNEKDEIILNIIEDTDWEGQHASAETVNKEPFGDGLCGVTDAHIILQPGFVAEQEAERNFGLAEVNVGGSKSSPDLCPLGLHVAGDQACAKRSFNDNREVRYDHVQRCILCPKLDGITDQESVRGDEELIHKKKNTTDSSLEGQFKHTGDSSECFPTARKSIIEEINDLSRELSNLVAVPADHFITSEESRVAIITLDLNDPFVFRIVKPITADVQEKKAELNQEAAEKMPHKTHKNTSESKTRSKKDKSGGHRDCAQVPKKQESLSPNVSTQQNCNKQETHPPIGENHTCENAAAGVEQREAKLVIETDVAAEKPPSKPHAKKKKKHGQSAAAANNVPLTELENGAKPKGAKGRIDMFEAKLGAKAGKAEKDHQSAGAQKKPQHPAANATQGEQPLLRSDHQPKSFTSPLNDDVIKRRRLSGDKFGKIVSVLESKIPKADVSIQAMGAKPEEEAGSTRKKAYSEVVKQKILPVEEAKVVQPIQSVSVSGDPQSVCLWCEFAAVVSDHTVTWSREGTVLSETKRSAGDESKVSLTISNTSHKDLGKYQCRLSSLHGSVTLDYLLTYEVLSEIVIPSTPTKSISSTLEVVGKKEEDVHCSRLMFKEDFLCDQYFGDNHPVSIITEEVHFGEGMHRRAFRTKLQAGKIPLLLPGHTCVLKVHNAISYGTKNNDELIQKNFSLAVEECQVQNTAREYIKEYTTAAQSIEAFGEVPEIIPIYLIHRPSNDIPYATLEEELIGDFVKYSVKDGKEINLMRRDSEAGQKCCAFQHWVYHKTEGNLLVTDMQGVGMRLTDVGIATCKKGYKGFKGNCATSFIDQFKALHQCNTYCEILGLKSLQPKAKKPASTPKPKSQTSAAAKKKPFGPRLNGKS